MATKKRKPRAGKKVSSAAGRPQKKISIKSNIEQVRPSVARQPIGVIDKLKR